MCIGIYSWFLLLDMCISQNNRAPAKWGKIQPACIRYTPTLLPKFLLVQFQVCNLSVTWVQV